MFIQQAVNGENKFWKYLIGSVVVIAATFIGQLPLIVALLLKSFGSGDAFPTTNEEVTKYLDSNLTLFLLLLSFVFALAALFGWQRVIHKQSIRSLTTTRKSIDWGRIIFAFGIWAVFLIVITGADYIMQPEIYEINFHLRR